jgi:hypothetical protein
MQHPALNPILRENWGAPRATNSKGLFEVWLPWRKLLTPNYLPSRWERLKIKGWVQNLMPIPSDPPGMFFLEGNDSQEYAGQTVSYFALAGFLAVSNQPEGISLSSLYDMDQEQSLISTSGPALWMSNLAGDAKHPFWLKKLHFMDPGDTILATLTNLSANVQQGQLVAVGFAPVTQVVLPPGPKPLPPGTPFYVRNVLRNQ